MVQSLRRGAITIVVLKQGKEKGKGRCVPFGIQTTCRTCLGGRKKDGGNGGKKWGWRKKGVEKL